MTKQCSAKLFVFTALECEAKAIINQFNLKKENSLHAFSIYKNEQVVLTVTGIGKIAMAGAVSYTLALFLDAKSPILVNIGIAGHKSQAVGDLLVASKVLDVDSGKVFYPQLIGSGWPVACGVKTAAVANTVYEQGYLNDMEASAFYEMAVRFSTSELIHCVKVVSDNETSSIEHIQPKRVVEWIANQWVEINRLFEHLAQIRETLTPVELDDYEKIVSRWHFTVSGRVKLKALLRRWKVLSCSDWLDQCATDFVDGKELLRQLGCDIERLEIKL